MSHQDAGVVMTQNRRDDRKDDRKEDRKRVLDKDVPPPEVEEEEFDRVTFHEEFDMVFIQRWLRGQKIGAPRRMGKVKWWKE